MKNGIWKDAVKAPYDWSLVTLLTIKMLWYYSKRLQQIIEKHDGSAILMEHINMKV